MWAKSLTPKHNKMTRETLFSTRLHAWHALLLASFCLVFTGGCGVAPQLGGNEESLAAADSLWTAVTAKKNDLVEQSAGEIEKLHAAGTMPNDAFHSLSQIVASARAGQWPEARKALKTFARGQRPAKAKVNS